MQHQIAPHAAGPHTAAMTAAVESCVHCGFCLPACPTYQELGDEADSPRGRIVLIKELLEGSLQPDEVQPHLDRCLGCLACEPACPSGVSYRDLISPYRAQQAPTARRPRGERLRRWLTAWTLPHPARFRWALKLARLSRPLRSLLPATLRPMLDMVPLRIPAAQSLAPRHAAHGETRARVVLLAGCAQQVLDPDINLATIDVLTRNGVEVLVPPDQGCCGGLAWHTGDLPAAQSFARHNLNALGHEAVDAIITNAAGCGSTLHEYPMVLAGTEEADPARAFAQKAEDVTTFLDRLGLTADPPGFTPTRRVVMQDACHLANAQGVRHAPRRLLTAIPGIELVEPTDDHVCCGSAGTYNLDQPEMAAALGKRKANVLIQAEADLVASGNIGCQTQIRHHLSREGASLPVRHPIQILRDAYLTKLS